ncbi:IS30 family transposase [Kitasatospora sp. NPDC093679]|uniref:IS30 family transposase n=1 Tax=Kitasatospora sp. NPDC093679 TaxID=3154983 RepID=UPI0034387BF9
MGVGNRQREYRGQMPSPGRPSVAWREDRVRLWQAIARGLSSVDAAATIGVPPAVGSRWFRRAGGVNPRLAPSTSGRYLSFAEREEIALLRARDLGVRAIAQCLGRSPSTISRELRRNASTRTYHLDYRATLAQWHAERRAQRPRTAKLVTDQRLHDYVQDRLAGDIVHATDGRIVEGPQVPDWKGRNKPRRQDRRRATAWSPEQTSQRLRVDFPEDESMRISPEAIYQALYAQGRGALKRELVACLRTGRSLRVPRERTRQSLRGHVTADVLISERPVEAEDRAVPGHWEGGLIIGTGRSAIGTPVERTTRFTMLLHLPPMEGLGSEPRTKNGPALAGRGAEAVKDAITSTITTLPGHLRKSLTWDRGTELAQHAQLSIDAGLQVYFADPHSPWQRGPNENTNGLLRQYFPKGTDLSRWNTDELQAVAATLNSRPRTTLGWKTPAEALNEHLLPLQEAGVARTA